MQLSTINFKEHDANLCVTAANSVARMVVAGISDSLQNLLPTSVDDTTMSESTSDIEVEYDIASVIYNVVLGGSNGADDLDIMLAMETDLVSIHML